MTKQEKIIGILGGMGPGATLALYERVIALTPAKCDQDHLRVLIDSNPKIPDRTKAILGKGESPLAAMIESARTLERAGADFLVIPCNTAHYWLTELRETVSVPILDMIDEAVLAITEDRVGLLATDGVLFSRVYHDACERVQIKLLEPERDDQALVTQVIYRIKAGEEAETINDDITGVIARLHERGAKGVLIGCTELSLLPKQDLSLPIYDALDTLARAAVHRALSLPRGDGINRNRSR